MPQLVIAKPKWDISKWLFLKMGTTRDWSLCENHSVWKREKRIFTHLMKWARNSIDRASCATKKNTYSILSNQKHEQFGNEKKKTSEIMCMLHCVQKLTKRTKKPIAIGISLFVFGSLCFSSSRKSVQFCHHWKSLC